MTKKHDFHDLWRMYVSEKIEQDVLNEIGIDALKKLAGTGTRASDRLSGMRRPSRQASTNSAQKIKHAQAEPEAKNALVLRQKGELTAPQRKKVVNALVRVSNKYDIDLQKSAIKADTDIIDVILNVMEQLCVVQKYPVEWKSYSKDLRVKMEPLKQDPEQLISFFEGVAEQIKKQGGIGVDCDQLTTTQNLKQIQ